MRCNILANVPLDAGIVSIVDWRLLLFGEYVRGCGARFVLRSKFANLAEIDKACPSDKEFV